MKSCSPRLLSIALAAALLGCGAPLVVDDDAGLADSGVVTDGGFDAGAGDAGVTDDAGTTDDAGAPDAGVTDDAGTVDDAGTPDDAGTTTDAGLPDAGAADAGLPAFETAFSRRPANDTRDLTIENWLVSLIDAATPGSQVRVAIYTFTRGGPSAALLRAASRGVDVQVVVDGDAPSTVGSEVATLQAGLGSSRVHVCDPPGTACIGSGIMHHKTFLFSALADGSRNVVVQASHNLTNAQLSMHNNAVLVRGDAALYAAYRQTFDDLVADVEIPNYYRIDDGTLATRVYFFPRTTGDTSVSILDNVTCDATARIRVAMAFFTDARLAVAQALAARKQEGCDVRVVAGDAEIPVGSQVAATLTAAGVPLVRYPSRTGGWSLHSKYVVIDATYAGSVGHRRLVFTGSHNWTGPALTSNDETLLRVEDDGVVAAYFADWAHVAASAVKP